MAAFRILLVAFFAVLLVYTSIVMMNHGGNLLAVFFEDITKMGWPGQFDLDFMCMLALSALWVAWRHQFSGMGLLLAVVAFFGGTPFLGLYLLVLSLQTGGEMRAILLGKARAQS